MSARPRSPVQTSPLREREVVRLPADAPPALLVVIDTEEEFDWSRPFDRARTSVEAMRDVGRAQELFDRLGVRPVYVIDQPIASQEIGWRPLKEYQDDGRAVIGAHLHPWVTPPFEEELCDANSYPGNLPAELEERKLAHLARTIERNLGRRPTIYKAGRYGFGPNTAAILERLGFRCDLSPCAGFDLSADGGPDWSRLTPDAYRFGPGGRLLGLPATGAFVGWLAAWGAGLHRAAGRAPLRQVRAPGILSRSGALERLLLSPEGYTPAHLRRLTRALLRRGVRILSFSFHSPSLRPGCTPYVRSEADLKDLLASCRQYLEWFLGDLGGVTMTPQELEPLLAAPTAPTARSAPTPHVA